MRTLASLLAACTAALVIAACGGGDGTPAASASTTVSGAVVKGPVNGATVSFYAVDSAGAKGTLLGTTTTSITGAYTISLSYGGDILIEATGGNYLDEASGTTKPLAETMRVVVSSGAGGSSVTGIVTPLSTAAYSLSQVGGAATSARYQAAVSSIAAQFNLSASTLGSTVPSVTGTINDYGRILRAVSQYVQNGGNLNTFLTWSNPGSFSAAFSTAYGAINGGSPITFSFNANGITVGGVGGGGSGQCGISAAVTVNNAPGGTFNYCISGLPESSCQSGNQTLSSALSGQTAGYPAGFSVQYTYGPTCAQGAFPITLTP